MKSSRMLVVIMAGVVVSFVLSTVATQYRENKIDALVKNLTGNALPSIQELSNIQTGLRDIVVHAQQISGAPAATRPKLEALIRKDKHSIESALQSYSSLPWFPGERELATKVEELKPEFFGALDLYLVNIKKGNTVPPPVHDRFESSGLMLDHALLHLVEFDVRQAQRLGNEISAIRSQSVNLAVLLNFLNVGLACVATVLSVRLTNASVRVMEDKAKELEIFAGRVAHDLKNPLGAILMAGDIAEKNAIDPTTRKNVQRITSISQRMNQMIDGLLEFALSGAHPRPGAKAELNGMLDTLMDSIKAEAEGSNVHVAVERRSGSISLACSEGVLGSILTNLIRNAIKYVVDGSESEKRVCVRVKDHGSRARIEVEDNGPGIEDGHVQSVFEPYFRANQKHPGLGLGLATVKRLVESHGGQVGVISTPGRGCLFWFELPKA